ncbi:MAG: ABC-F family ATP-binding cassette domain-containing protein [Anaerolineae bacterium]|nr:ABC-F family ATP-binding cassette domain-containing protein [Anaerolineae bacterium]
MSIISGVELAKSFGAQDIFAGLSFDIPRGARIALVGPNGCGKTTLLRLIVGLESPSAGQIQSARGLRIGYMPQQAQMEAQGTLWQAMEAVFGDLLAQAERLRQLEAAMANPERQEAALERYGPLLEAFELAGGYTYSERIKRVLTGLGFSPDELEIPLAHLSGGQRTRALLARLLLENPDLLLLDEPTNHLDLDGVEWLEEYLQKWEGSLLIVAHDRAFLDQVVGQVWELSFGQLTTYRGNYSHYVAQREERIARQQESYERQQAHIARTEDYIQRYIAGQRTRQAQGRKKRLDRIERIERPREQRTMSLDLGRPLRSGDLVLGLYNLSVGYTPQAPLFFVDETELRRGQRVALLGPNGSGKTTLLRTVLEEIEPLAGRIRLGAGVHVGYFAQAHAGLDLDKTLLDTIMDAGLPSLSRARDLLGRYRFSGDDVFKQVRDLSGGEQARVALALLAMEGANLLLLDEPTNHLDIPSQEIMQEVLGKFQGSILLVAHDRYLIRALASHVWAIVAGQLRTFSGYDAYRDWLREQHSVRSADPEPGRQEWEAEREARRRAEREAEYKARRRSEAEAAIHALEERLAQVEAELARASTAQDVERVTKLGVEHAQLQQELDVQWAAWAELS